MRRIATIALLAALLFGGCGDDEAGEPETTPSGPFAETLAELGGGGANASLGVSWVDPRQVARAGGGGELIADVLAPNADTVVEASPALERRFGFDPLEADRLVSVGGSYAFGIRLDGVDGRGLARSLVDAGGRSRPGDGVRMIEIGDYAVVPRPLLAADVNGLGAYDALGPDLSVLAISDRARSALLGEGDRLFDEPTYAAAAGCLGNDVVAARMVPDKQLLSIETGIDMVAIGVTAGGDVLCALGGSPERADEVEKALRVSLAPDARDPVTGEPLSASVDGVEVTRETVGDVEVVRAELELAPGADPGFLFATIPTGSLVSILNGDPESFLP